MRLRQPLPADHCSIEFRMHSSCAVCRCRMHCQAHVAAVQNLAGPAAAAAAADVVAAHLAAPPHRILRQQPALARSSPSSRSSRCARSAWPSAVSPAASTTSVNRQVCMCLCCTAMLTKHASCLLHPGRRTTSTRQLLRSQWASTPRCRSSSRAGSSQACARWRHQGERQGLSQPAAGVCARTHQRWLPHACMHARSAATASMPPAHTRAVVVRACMQGRCCGSQPC